MGFCIYCLDINIGIIKMPKKYTNYKKTSKTPRKPFDKDRLINELKVVGEYGLRNKREVWRVSLTLAKLRKAARELLTLDDRDPRRLFEGTLSSEEWSSSVSLRKKRESLIISSV